MLRSLHRVARLSIILHTQNAYGCVRTARPYLSGQFILQHKPIQWNVSTFHSTTFQKEQEQPVDPKHQLLIGFTCQVCKERSHHTMSKLAYTKGVVLIQCPGCQNRHLIADNLGWFKDSKTNIEDIVREKGEAIRKITVDEGGAERLGDLMEWLPEISAEESRKMKEAKKE